MKRSRGLLDQLSALNVGVFPDARDVTHLFRRTKRGAFTLTQYKIIAGTRGLILWYDKTTKRVYVSRAPDAAHLIKRSKATAAATDAANRNKEKT